MFVNSISMFSVKSQRNNQIQQHNNIAFGCNRQIISEGNRVLIKSLKDSFVSLEEFYSKKLKNKLSDTISVGAKVKDLSLTIKNKAEQFIARNLKDANGRDSFLFQHNNLNNKAIYEFRVNAEKETSNLKPFEIFSKSAKNGTLEDCPEENSLLSKYLPEFINQIKEFLKNSI